MLHNLSFFSVEIFPLKIPTGRIDSTLIFVRNFHNSDKTSENIFEIFETLLLKNSFSIGEGEREHIRNLSDNKKKGKSRIKLKIKIKN